MNDKITVIYDIETLSNAFTYTAINKDSEETFKYVIWGDTNDFYDLLVHLSQCKGQIGFNNINFDYPVIHYLIKNKEYLIKLDADQIAKKIYKKAQEVISMEFSSVKETEVFIPQLDLFCIWHFFNKSRMTSLKKLEINMQFDNVMDMPYSHTEKIESQSQINEILVYNLNDVVATKLFYDKTKDKIDLRRGLLEKYGLNCLNYSDSKIGEQLMLKLYCEYSNQEEEYIKRKRTYRESFKFIECIPDYITFETPEFNELLNYIKGIEVTELKESFKYSFEYKGFTFDLGTGGIHACIKAGVYESNDDMVIVDCDVASLYPSLAITLGLYPEHLGEEFPKIYEEGIVIPRLHAKEYVDGKMRDKVMADGYKLSANAVYGKSNSEYSFLYDPLYTIKTTLAGQLALCMLSEMLMTKVPNLQMLQVNTDGISVSIPVEHKKLYWEVCQQWEHKTKLVLEYVAYSKMIIRDVNNYIAITDKTQKVKYKGTFKPVSEMIKDGEYHKSFSQNAVTLAVSNYFLKNVSVEDSLKNNANIYDFCKTFNATHGWTSDTSDIEYKDISYLEAVEKLTDLGWYEAHTKGFYIPPNGGNMSGLQLLEEGNKTKVYKNIVKQQKTNRYYISDNGKTFRKLKEDKIIEIEAGGNLVTIFNKYEDKPITDYNINFQYYIDECYKIIHIIDGTTERIEKEQREERIRKKLEKEEENYVKYCIDKIPTELQYKVYNREWLQEKYGVPSYIKPSKQK